MVDLSTADGQETTLATRPPPLGADDTTLPVSTPTPIQTGSSGNSTANNITDDNKEVNKEKTSAMADATTESTPAAAAAAVAAPEDVPKTTEPVVADAETKTDSDSAETKPPEEAPATEAAEASTTEAPEAAADEPAAETKEDAPAADAAPAAADDAAETAKPTPAKPSVARRKSTNQKLNRKASKARITHMDAKPGEHYFVKLKGYPAWPVIVCDEDMLPQTLIKSRPVSAARADGTYREDYADGGKRAADRVFPVMYLYTNEFGWVPNTDMHDLDPEKVLDSINDKMRKDLQAAHRLAAENNPLSHYKDLLRQFQEELEQMEEAKRQAAATPKKSKKAAAAKDGDVDMMDVPADDDSAPVPKKSASKKRKAENDAKSPQHADSAKKPKIKITSSGTPQKERGAHTAELVKKQVQRELNMSPEEKRRRKAKEVLFLRHKIQKGLLTRDEAPKEEEMEAVSDFLRTLETFAEVEASIIRETKIHKVLKAILKIPTIPREEEFHFKGRSRALLDVWNTILAANPAPEPAAGKTDKAKDADTNGQTEGKDKEKASSKAAEPEKPKDEVAAEDKTESKEETATEPAKEATEETAPVEAAA